MKNKLNILVVGATGQQGGAAARALLRNGHHVAALTRKPEGQAARDLAELGAKIVEGDLNNKNKLIEYAQGMDGIFGVSTFFEEGLDAEVQQGYTIVEAAKAAQIKHLVFSSVGSADQGTGIDHFESKYKIEQRILESGVPYTIIAPVFFMENWFGPWFLPSLQEGKVALAMPAGRKMQEISIEDIGNFAALAFERPGTFLGRRFDIAGDDLTGEEVAEVISRRLHRKLEYFEIPMEAMQSQNPGFAKMFKWFDDVGYSVDLDQLKRDYPEVGWTDFATWVERQDWSALAGSGEKAS